MLAFFMAAIGTAIYFLYDLVKSSIGRHVEIEWERKQIFGWYKGNILASGEFRYNATVEEIRRVKQQVSKELDEKIKVYKEVYK